MQTELMSVEEENRRITEALLELWSRLPPDVQGQKAFATIRDYANQVLRPDTQKPARQAPLDENAKLRQMFRIVVQEYYLQVISGTAAQAGTSCYRSGIGILVHEPGCCCLDSS